jgi:uncharacterized Zn finger protein
MSDQEARGFPAFAAQAGRRSTRGRSWWGREWVRALEESSLDSDQLRKGRRTANSGHVGPITISPGRIAAAVYSPEDTYQSEVIVDRLSDDEWRQFLDQVGARAGHIAALLDGEMPYELVEAAEDAGVPLLPGIGDLDPSCTCDAWELPCQHAASLCYQVGWLLDSDPFVLLLMRGRTREHLLDDLQHQMSAGIQSPSTPSPDTETASGQPADEVFPAADGRDSQAPVLPAVPDLPVKIAREDLAINGTQPLPDLDPGLLPLLVLDAARRSRAQLSALLSGAPDPWLLDEWQDAVRLATDYPELHERLSIATGRPADLTLGVQAWSYGGAPGLDVLEHTWTPDPSELARAKAELLAASDDPDGLEIEVDGNRLSVSGDSASQLRLDRVGRWHPYRLVDDAWTPAGPADRDPTTASTPQESW